MSILMYFPMIYGRMMKLKSKLTKKEFFVKKHAKDVRRMLKNKRQTVSAKAIANT